MQTNGQLTRRKFVAAACGLSAAAVFGLTGCGGGAKEEKKEAAPAKPDEKKDDKKAEKKDEKKPAGNLEGTIVAVGSSAMQPLVEAAAEEFRKQNPKLQITVQGGGSGQGLTQISQGSVEIGNSDVFAEDKKIDPTNLKDNKICIVGMGPVCNKDVTVDNLSKDQLKGIFTGKITNWKDVGGKDEPIVVINRAAGSGTRATFEAFALDGESAMQAQEQDNSGTALKMVSETPGAITYLAFSYYNDKIKPLSVDGVKPEEKNIEDNSWTIWAYEHSYTAKDPKPEVKAFIDFMLSEDVQKNLVPKLGYIPISGMKIERNAAGEIKNL